MCYVGSQVLDAEKLLLVTRDLNIEALITTKCQHLLPSFNKERHGTAFAILAMFCNNVAVREK